MTPSVSLALLYDTLIEVGLLFGTFARHFAWVHKCKKVIKIDDITIKSADISNKLNYIFLMSLVIFVTWIKFHDN